MFTDDEYRDAVVDYLAHAGAIGASSTFAGYSRWVAAEDRAGRSRPSSPALRLRYGNWMNARRMVSHLVSEHSGRVTTGAAGTTVASEALQHTRASIEQFVQSSLDLGLRELGERIPMFVNRTVQDFEVRHRDWMREVVAADDSVVKRVLGGSVDLSRRERALLEESPPAVQRLLTDRYLDRQLSSRGPGGGGGWLSQSAADELARLPDTAVAAYEVLRAARNFFVHDSDESRTRLEAAIGRLAAHDQSMALTAPITRRIVIDWLRASGLRRLKTLCDSILSIWRVLLVTEATSRLPAEPNLGKQTL